MWKQIRGPRNRADVNAVELHTVLFERSFLRKVCSVKQPSGVPRSSTATSSTQRSTWQKPINLAVVRGCRGWSEGHWQAKRKRRQAKVPDQQNGPYIK